MATIAATTVGESRINSQESTSYRAWIVVFSAALFFFYEFMLLNLFNALNEPLLQEFHISATELGQVSAYYFYANLVFLFPAGILLDRLSTRKMILAAMTLSVIATFMFAGMHAIWMAKLCRFLMGMGSSFCLLGCVRLASRWFPPKRMALIVGLIVTFAMLGGMMAQMMTVFVEHSGWRHAMQALGASGVVMIMIMFTFVRDFPKDSIGSLAKEAAQNTLSFWQSMKMALGNAQNWLGGLYTSTMNLPIFLLGAIWGTMYLEQMHNIPRTQASIITTMIFFGTVVGSPFLGWFSDRIGLRRTPMWICALLSLAVMLVLVFMTGLPFWSLVVLFFALGFFTSAQIISYPLIAESNPNAITGTATGIASILIMGGGVSQPVFGWLLGLHWNHKLVHGVPYYSHIDYEIAMSMMPIAFVVALIATWIIKETYCKARD